MIDESNLSEEMRAKLRRIQEHKKVLADEEQKFYRDLGITATAPADPAAQMQREEEQASLYDRLTAQELVDLYLNDRPRWQGIMRAKEQQGLRKLFSGGR